jgi:hypothetical protein
MDSDYNLFVPAGSSLAEGSHSSIQASAVGIVMHAAASDFRLVAGSPAIHGGINLSVFPNLAAGTTSFSGDLPNSSRPPSGPWDVGAYEFVSLGLAAPTNVRILP